jgi:hypothetical protein
LVFLDAKEGIAAILAGAFYGDTSAVISDFIPGDVSRTRKGPILTRSFPFSQVLKDLALPWATWSPKVEYTFT